MIARPRKLRAAPVMVVRPSKDVPFAECHSRNPIRETVKVAPEAYWPSIARLEARPLNRMDRSLTHHGPGNEQAHTCPGKAEAQHETHAMKHDGRTYSFGVEFIFRHGAISFSWGARRKVSLVPPSPKPDKGP